MAKTKKQKNIDKLNYQIDEEKELVKNWKKYNISLKKIDKMEAQQAKHEADLVIWDV